MNRAKSRITLAAGLAKAESPWLDTAGLSRALGICSASVLRWRKRGWLPEPVKMGAGYVWVVAEVLRWVEQRHRTEIERTEAFERLRSERAQQAQWN